jgi:uncharacterized protein (TIGR00297 family)
MNAGFDLLVALAIGLLVVGAAWHKRALTQSGAIASTAIGIAAAVAGWKWVTLLLVYFVSSTVLSRIGRGRKLERTSGVVAKPGARDGWQVLSNGGVFGIMAIASIVDGATDLWLLLGTGALAASAADTWATEIGTLVGGQPKSILTWRTLPVGASGGVTLAGTEAATAGAMFIAVIGIAVGLSGAFWTVTLAGLLGAIADSVIGALAQQRRWCDACDGPTEMHIHSCGTATRHVGGLRFIQNDSVNLLATIVGAAAAFGLSPLI